MKSFHCRKKTNYGFNSPTTVDGRAIEKKCRSRRTIAPGRAGRVTTRQSSRTHPGGLGFLGDGGTRGRIREPPFRRGGDVLPHAAAPCFGRRRVVGGSRGFARGVGPPPAGVERLQALALVPRLVLALLLRRLRLFPRGVLVRIHEHLHGLDDDRARRRRPVVRIRRDAFHLGERLHPAHHGAKHRVLPVQVRGGLVAHEELRAVGVRAAVRHGHDAPPRVLQVRDFISERSPPDALPAPPGAGGVAALHHEVLHRAVERDAVVVPGARERDEVLAGPRRDVAV